MWSKRMYFELPRREIGLFKFLLEAWDNLGYCSVVDKYRAVVLVVCAPDQEQELQEFVQSIQGTLNVRYLGRGLSDAILVRGDASS